MESQASALTATSAITHEMEKAKSNLSIRDNLPVYIKELIAGGVAGGFAKTAVAPLERLKILFQTRAGNFQRLGISRSLISISQTEGLRGFYRGNGASVVRIVPYAALHFMTYEQYRRWLLANCPSAGTGPVVDLLAGSLAGGTAVLCTYPLDFVRTRLAYQVPNTSRNASVKFYAYTGIRDVISSVYQHCGVRGLYRGLAPTLYGILPYAGLKFYVYESLKEYLTTEEESSLFVKLGCGALAGLIGQTFTYPLDVVRRQMQVEEAFFASNKTSEGIPYKGTVDGLKYVARTQGWRQMFAGLSINYVKIIPSVAIGFVAYDGMKAWLRVPPRQKSLTKFSEDEENIKK